jgi:hypothetical protein
MPLKATKPTSNDDHIPLITDPTNTFSDKITLLLSELFFEQKENEMDCKGYKLISGITPVSSNYSLKIISKDPEMLEDYKENILELLKHLELNPTYVLLDSDFINIIFHKDALESTKYQYIEISDITEEIITGNTIPGDIYKSMVSSFINSREYDTVVYEYFDYVFGDKNIKTDYAKKYILDKISATLVFFSTIVGL